MPNAGFHVKVNVYHRPHGGGTYIARYTVGDRVIEGYGRGIGEALEELGKVVQRHPNANGERYE